jgi:hypothetical protein
VLVDVVDGDAVVDGATVEVEGAVVVVLVVVLLLVVVVDSERAAATSDSPGVAFTTLLTGPQPTALRAATRKL